MKHAFHAAWPHLLLLLLPFVVFWRVWWPAEAARRVFQYGDFVEQHYPMRVFVADEYRHGRLPLWDPYTFGGEPAVAMSLFAPYYPPGLWQVIFPKLPFEALEIEAIFHLGLAGVFTFLFVRRLTGSPGAGLIAGLAFSLGGYLTSYPMLQLIILETAVWLPAGLWLLDRALAARSLAQVAVAGAIFGFGVLAGHPQTFLYVAYAAAAYFMFRAVRLRLPVRFAIPAAVILGAGALGISAAHWLPGLQMYGLSPRAGLTYAEIANGFRPLELWGLLRPNPGQWSPLYVGLMPPALAVCGLALWRKAEPGCVSFLGQSLRGVSFATKQSPPMQEIASRRSAKTMPDAARNDTRPQTEMHPAEPWFWAALGLVALLLSLGRHGFLYPLFYRIAPGFATFRDQERIALLVSFALAVLAGYGAAALLRRLPAVRHPLTPDSRLLTPVLALLIFLDLFRANQGVILQTPPPGGYFAKTPIVTHIQSASAPGWRTSSEGLLPGDGEAGLVFQIRDIVGSGPLYLAAYDRFLAQVPEERWWRMLNVQHLITRRDLSHGALKLVRQDDDLRLYQVFQQAALAWIVHDTVLAADQAAAIRATAAPDFDPFQRAVLEQSDGLNRLPRPQPPTGAERVELVTFANQRVAVDVTLTAPGVVVLSEMAYPGWTVRANGQGVPALRAYGLLRAVALPAGQWRVEWRFEPLIAYLGLAVSLATMGIICGWAWGPRFSSKRPVTFPHRLRHHSRQ
jgi:hypothetical protein